MEEQVYTIAAVSDPVEGLMRPASCLLYSHEVDDQLTEPFLGGRLLYSYSRTSQHIVEPEDLLRCSHLPSTRPYREPNQTSKYHPILSL
jgi:hypothetical protein